LSCLGLLKGEVVRGLKVDATYKFASRVCTFVTLYPIVQSLDPHFGPIAGGTRIVATGVRFNKVERVTIGAKDCKFDPPAHPFQSLTITTAARTQTGSWDVVVHTTDGAVGVCLSKFTYVENGWDEKRQPPPKLSNPAAPDLKIKRNTGFRAVRSVLITAMTDRNIILHSDFAPDDTTERTLAILRKVFAEQKGGFHLESVHVDNARKLTSP
jgi:hypothetical protein